MKLANLWDGVIVGSLWGLVVRYYLPPNVNWFWILMVCFGGIALWVIGRACAEVFDMGRR